MTAAADAIYVSMSGTDAGDCTAAAPCLTVIYALGRVTATRRVVRVVSSDYQTEAGISIDRDVFLDGNETRLQRSTPGPVLAITSGATATIEGFRIDAAPSSPSLVVNSLAVVTAYGIELGNGSDVQVTGGVGTVLRFRRSHVIAAELACAAYATLEVRESTLERANVVADACSVVIARNLIADSDIDIDYEGADPATIENNLFRQGVSRSFLSIASNAAEVRFNTFATGIDAEPTSFPAFVCSGPTVRFSSNIAALVTTSPFNSPTSCSADHSLFNSEVGAVSGEGNRSEPYDAIFVDPANANYRTATTSMAIQAGDPDALLTEDLTGALRPQPAGTPADSGAYELP